MKTLITISLLLLGSLSFGQTQQFAQGLFVIEDQTALLDLEAQIRQNNLIEVARLDIPSQRFFFLTNGSSEITTEKIQQLFGSYASTISCIQIGVYGQDQVNRFPFTNCQE